MREILKYIQNNPDTTIALCALLLSVVSITFAWFALKLQQEHNRLSVRPIGKIHFITFKDHIKIEVRNDGIGPMLCSNVKIYDEEFNIKDNLRDAILILQKKNGWLKVNTSAQFAIGAGDQKVLLEISTEHVNPEFQNYYDQVLASLRKITLEVEYRDIYNQYIGTLRKAKWTT